MKKKLNPFILLILQIFFIEGYSQGYYWAQPDKDYPVNINEITLDNCFDLYDYLNHSDEEKIGSANCVWQADELRTENGFTIFSTKLILDKTQPNHCNIKINLFNWPGMTAQEKQEMITFYDNFYYHLKNHFLIQKKLLEEGTIKKIKNIKPSAEMLLLEEGPTFGLIETELGWKKENNLFKVVPKHEEKWKESMVFWINEMDEAYDKATDYGKEEKEVGLGADLIYPICYSKPRKDRYPDKFGIKEIIVIRGIKINLWNATSEQKEKIIKTLNRLPFSHLLRAPHIICSNGGDGDPFFLKIPDRGGSYLEDGGRRAVKLSKSSWDKRINKGTLHTLLHEFGHAMDKAYDILGEMNREGRDKCREWVECCYSGKARKTRGPGEAIAEAYAYYFNRYTYEDTEININKEVPIKPIVEFLQNSKAWEDFIEWGILEGKE